MDKKRIENLIMELHTSLGDNEVMHVRYDEILKEIAKAHEPELLAIIDKIVDGRQFWYA